MQILHSTNRILEFWRDAGGVGKPEADVKKAAEVALPAIGPEGVAIETLMDCSGGVPRRHGRKLPVAMAEIARAGAALLLIGIHGLDEPNSRRIVHEAAGIDSSHALRGQNGLARRACREIGIHEPGNVQVRIIDGSVGAGAQAFTLPEGDEGAKEPNHQDPWSELGHT